MSIEAVREHFKKWNREEDIIEFDVSSATVELAAKALGCEPERIAKSISLYRGDGAMIIVCAGNVKIDNQKFKATFQQKAKMLSYDDTEAFTGHRVGGVCPFGVKEGVEIYLDNSLKEFDAIYPACGSSNSAIRLTPTELEEYTDYIMWVDVCKKMGE